MTAAVLPPKEHLVQCMDIASTPDASKYLSERFEAILAKKNMLQQFDGLVKKFETYATEVSQGAELATSSWKGEMPLTAYANASEQRVRAIEQQVPQGAALTVPIAIGIDFADEGKLNRGYLVNNIPASPEEIQLLDTSFHGWLASQGLLCRKPYIYEATEHGKIKTDNDGTPIKADLAQLETALKDEGRGLKSYIEAHAYGFKVELLQIRIPTVVPKDEPGVPAA